MRKILLGLLFLPFLTQGQSNENYIKSTTYKTPFFGTVPNISTTSFMSSSLYVCAGTGGGGASNSYSLIDNQLNINFAGSWSSTCRLNLGTIADLTPNGNSLPDINLGAITQTGGAPTCYSAKIRNGNLIFYSPYYPIATHTILEVSYISSINYTSSLSNIYTCTGSSGGGASGFISVSDNKVKLSLQGSWSEMCNLTTGPIHTLNVSPVINYLELGTIKGEDGDPTVYKAAISNNVLMFYSDETIPAPVTNINTTFIYNLGLGVNKIENITYFDGLGRPMQHIAVKAGGEQQDIITPVVYDEFGRKTREYLPYSNPIQSSSSLNYRDNNQLIPTLNLRYLEKYPNDLLTVSPNPYKETFFELSPTNRVVKQASPGKSWIGSQAGTNDHTIKFEYGLNSLNDKIKRFKVSRTWNGGSAIYDYQLIIDDYYPQESLFVLTTRNENWKYTDGNLNTTFEYTDDSGKLILKRTFVEGSLLSLRPLQLDTYYVYDNIGNLIYVVPPKADIVTTVTRTQIPFVYNKFVEKNDFLDVINGGNSPTGSGGLTITVENSTLKLIFNAIGLGQSYIDTSFSIPTNVYPPIPDMTIGTLNSRYTVLIKDNHINFFDNLPNGGSFTTLSQTLTASLDPQLFTSTTDDIFVINQTILEDLCYQYKYDFRNRLVEKKLPGKGWEKIVYDKLDRVVLTQDAILNGQAKWLFLKYDAFGRVLYTGDFISASTRTTLQSNLNTLVYPKLSESCDITGFSNGTLNIYYSRDAFPQSFSNIYTVNYYDDYIFLPTGSTLIPETVYDVPITQNTKSLSTGTFTRVLGSDNWIKNVMAYDTKARAIFQFTEDKFLKYDNTIESKLDFEGKLIESKTSHRKQMGTQVIFWASKTDIDNYMYDHAGRLTKQTKKNSQSDRTELITFNKYDELGQLEQKKVGGTSRLADTFSQAYPIQTIKYSNNIRGWLTQINNPDNLGNDLFGFRINYDNPSSGGVALYNGNISQTIWKTKNDIASNTIRSYNYKYDSTNRLTEANSVKVVGTTQYSGLYNEKLEYDKNGNINTLQRWGTSDVSAVNIDRLVYTYNGNQLISVNESISGPEGFTELNTTGQDYFYDVNGNMTKDLNKGIGSSTAGITYNHLNLPKTVSFTSTKFIDYEYSAGGVKLRKKVTDGVNVTTTDYCGGYVYEKVNNNSQTLQYYEQPEGYIDTDGDYIYQYKDHLGNIRLSYTGVPQQVMANTFISSADGFTPKSGATIQLFPDDIKVNVTNGYAGIKKDIVTNAVVGDRYRFKISVDRRTTNKVRIVITETHPTTLASIEYVAFVLTDQWTYDFDYVVQQYSKISISIDKDPTSSDAGSLTYFHLMNVIVDKITTGIIEENNYYAFGMSHTGYNNVSNMGIGSSGAQKYKYNGKELQDELGLNLYDYGWRNYDPALGKWMNIDALAEITYEESPYHYAHNNPVIYIDPTGLTGEYWETRYVDDKGKTLLDTNDGSDDIVVVPKEKVNDFIYYAKSYKKDGMKYIYDSAEWNNNMKADILGFETINEMNRLLDGFSTQWSRQKAINYIQNPTMANGVAMAYAEALSQWSDPQKVMAAASVFAAMRPRVNAAEGIIYLRTDRAGVLKPYVGQAKNEARYLARQKEHARTNPDSDFEFKVIDRGTAQGQHPTSLDIKEQKALNNLGGPTNKQNPNGKASNKKNVIKQ